MNLIQTFYSYPAVFKSYMLCYQFKVLTLPNSGSKLR